MPSKLSLALSPLKSLVIGSIATALSPISAVSFGLFRRNSPLKRSSLIRSVFESPSLGLSSAEKGGFSDCCRLEREERIIIPLKYKIIGSNIAFKKAYCVFLCRKSLQTVANPDRLVAQLSDKKKKK